MDGMKKLSLERKGLTKMFKIITEDGIIARRELFKRKIDERSVSTFCHNMLDVYVKNEKLSNLNLSGIELDYNKRSFVWVSLQMIINDIHKESMQSLSTCVGVIYSNQDKEDEKNRDDTIEMLKLGQKNLNIIKNRRTLLGHKA